MNKKEYINIQTVVSAPVDRVWENYTGPEHIIHWNNASDDWHTPRAENDLKPGGKFLYRMEAKDGSFGFDFWGIYDKLIPNEIIAYTHGDERKVTVTFTGYKNTTTIEVKFEAELTNPIDMQRNGWQAILINFKTYVEAQDHDKI